MLHVALYRPEIPPNTGNVARLCAAVDAPLHIVGQPSFRLDDRAVRRAGLDYWPHVQLQRHRDFDDLRSALGSGSRLLYFSARVHRPFWECAFRETDCLVFGNESAGLPASILEDNEDSCFAIPILNPNIRSLNLATAAGIVLYEAVRQLWPSAPSAD